MVRPALAIALLALAGCAGHHRAIDAAPGPAPADGEVAADRATVAPEGPVGQRDAAGAGPDTPADQAAPPITAAVSWPQAGGPEGTFRFDVPDAPTRWSVAADENVL